MIVVPFMFSWIAWVIFSTIRRYKIAKLQAEVQSRLLDKVGSGQELLAYAQMEAGKSLLESLSVERPSPYGRMFSALQIGVILVLVGAALLFFAKPPTGGARWGARCLSGVRHIDHCERLLSAFRPGCAAARFDPAVFY